MLVVERMASCGSTLSVENVSLQNGSCHLCIEVNC